jgi:hypothetical protein
MKVRPDSNAASGRSSKYSNALRMSVRVPHQ